jgi:hypothetical protein
MNRRHTFLVTVTSAMLVAGMIVGLSILSSKTALARSETSETANHFGKGASTFGKEGTMGEHSKAGGAAGDPPFDDDGKPGRSGIGNVGQDIVGCDKKVKPGQLADILTNQGGCP